MSDLITATEFEVVAGDWIRFLLTPADDEPIGEQASLRRDALRNIPWFEQVFGGYDYFQFEEELQENQISCRLVGAAIATIERIVTVRHDRQLPVSYSYSDWHEVQGVRDRGAFGIQVTTRSGLGSFGFGADERPTNEVLNSGARFGPAGSLASRR